MPNHIKALRCKIDSLGKISILRKNYVVSIPVNPSAEKSIETILEKYPNENIVIKKEQSSTAMLFSGKKNKAFVRRGGRNPPLKGTTKWIYLVKEDGTSWTIIDNGPGNRYIGQQKK